VIDDGYWLYNDLAAAKEQAKESGKPIDRDRCIPCEHCAGLDQDVGLIRDEEADGPPVRVRVATPTA
jgi:hypothetical protein